MASRLAEKLLAELRARFAGHGLSAHEGKSGWVTFPAAHPEVGTPPHLRRPRRAYD
jgi:hypothetical protein